MGWLREKYTKEYFLQRSSDGQRLPYGVHGIEYWQQGSIYPAAKRLLDTLELSDATVLDIGFGRGEAIRYAIMQGASLVIGVDFADAAIEIAQETLRDVSNTKYRLIHGDALPLLQNHLTTARFTHVLMLDVIEHLPRCEVAELLSILFRSLIPGGSLVIHTPLYAEDEDLFATGGKPQSLDSSDRFPETQGMHINRYSSASLENQVCSYGFIRWSQEVFLRPSLPFPIWKYRGPGRRILGKSLGYKLR